MNPTAVAITTHSERYREAIRRTLLHRAEGFSDASAVAKTIAGTWLQMADLLAPVIGAQGVDVLFRRSLHLANSAFHCLVDPGEQEDDANQLAILQARLASQSKDDAAEAGYNLLVTFTELLASLIGESLTERILQPAWESPSPATEQETES